MTNADAVDRKLFSEHFRENFGGLEPLGPITAKQVTAPARELELPEPEVRQRYARLAERFGLKLAWTAKPRAKSSKRKSPASKGQPTD